MKAYLILILLFCMSTGHAQTGPRTWRDHMSNSNCNTVAKVRNTVYASYVNGLIRFNTKELAPQTLNKSNGLSDVGIRLLRANPYNNKLLVIYESCNIDVIDGEGNIHNYPEFKLKTLQGKKFVNEVTFVKNLAYLSCGFGIVVFDTDKMEIRDTYIIGPAGTNMEVYQIAFTDSMIYAATERCMYKANHKTALLRDFHYWKADSANIPAGPYCGVVYTGGVLLACYSPHKTDLAIIKKDTFYSLQSNNKWGYYPPFGKSGRTINKIGCTYGKLFFVLDEFGAAIRDINTGQIENICYSFNNNPRAVQVQDIFYDKDHTNNISYWVADFIYGLYQQYHYYEPAIPVVRNGMHRSTVSNIDIHKGRIGVSPAHIDQSGMGTYSQEGLNIYNFKESNEWQYFASADYDGGKVRDVTSVLFDRLDNSVFWSAGWEYGIMKYKDGKLIASYTPTNTPGMPELYAGHPSCSGLSMDKEGNLWFGQTDVLGYLSVIRRNGQFVNFKFDHGKLVRKTMVDRNGNVWMLHERDGGITVIKHNNFKVTATVQLAKGVGSGNLESNSVFSIAEDNDGRIWVGTDAGIRVFYSPAAIFGTGDFDAQPIKIVQDGNVELLLEKETVTSIAVDGANNKWVGTNSGGVYCFSPDGQKQLYHFTEDDSPLYSNSVIDLNYDATTGDVYIGSDMGLQSFRSVVVNGEEELSSIYAFPNPVRPGYQGTVLVRGLVNSSIVKITDESGNLVWETKSEGGQVEWPVQTLSGSRVASGVYTVYGTSSDGEQRALTKVLVVN